MMWLSGVTTLAQKRLLAEARAYFQHLLKGVGAGHAPAGTAKPFDHNSLIHALWRRFVELGMAVWIERVPTEARSWHCAA